MLGGGRALLMQAAHPLVAAAVVRHSGYREEPWRRLARTMTALYTIVFGTREDADGAGAAVQAVHADIPGAQNAGAQFWVHSTLVDTGLVMYERCVRRLAQREREEFYEQMTVVAQVFGVPERVLPPTLADFRVYQRDLIESDVLSVGADARAIAETVLQPPVPAALRPAVRTLALLNVGLLPEPLRERYGLGFGRRERALLAASDRVARRLVVPLLPRPLRDLTPRRTALSFALLSAFGR